MKRSQALAPLSRDHQHALDVALRLRRATAGTVADAWSRFRAFFAAEGRHHFAIEERLLLPALPSDDAEWEPVVRRITDDHAAIRAAADAPSQPPGVEAAQAVGQRLHDHVRFEERVAFALLEARLDEQQLSRLGTAVAAAEERDPRDPS